MSNAWTWTYHGADGSKLADPGLPVNAFPSQGDAETWIGESYEELVDQGVESVTLKEGGADVYGPMSLRADG